MTDPEPCVADASALLAVLAGEPEASTILQRLPAAVMSAVSWSEVLTRAGIRGHSTEGLLADLEAAGLRIEPFGAEDAAQAAALTALPAAVALSLGTRASLVLSRRLGIPILTRDAALASHGEASGAVIVVR